jgi:hypothetical protein
LAPPPPARTGPCRTAYRARPNGDDPDTCIFDIWSLQRYAPGAEPTLHRQFIPDWNANTKADFGLILSQDFQNFEHVQLGMKSRGFKGLRTNPAQESEIPNMHRALAEYLARSSDLDQSGLNLPREERGGEVRHRHLTTNEPLTEKADALDS